MSARLTGGYTALMVVLGTAAVVAPQLDAVTWSLIGSAGVLAILAGVRWHRPVPRTAWLLLAGGLLVQATGDVAFALVVDGPGDRSPLLADACYLAVYPLLAWGLLRFTRPSVLFRDRSALIDLLVFTSVGALLLWVVLVGPAVTATQLSTLEASMLATYAFGDLLLVGTLAAVLVTVRRSPAALLLAVGAAGLLAADLLYAHAEATGGWQPGSAPELGWVLLYGSWGMAALHPSMAQLTPPPEAGQALLSCRRRTLLVLSCLVPPAVLVVESLAGEVRDGPVIAVISAILFVLVFSRLSDVLETHSRSVQRERHLREACAALVSATDADEVGDAVRAAVLELMPASAAHRVVFAFDAPGEEPAVVGGGGPRVPKQPRSRVARRTRLLRTFTLPPGVIAQLGGFPVTLCCPLVRGEATAAPGMGTLFVAADADVLAGLHDTVEVLAAQATLALARIAVADQMLSRDGERYFRSVSQNSADVVLIVDEDDLIRYASPSLATMIGAEPAPFSPLAEVIHPDARDQVGHTLHRARRSHNPDGVREDWVLRRPDGSRVQVEVSCRDLRDDRMVQGLVITLRDVTERRRREQELIRRAVQDSAPGKNRRSVANRFRSY